MWSYLKELASRLLDYPWIMFLGLCNYLQLVFYVTLALFDHDYVIVPPENLSDPFNDGDNQ